MIEPDPEIPGAPEFIEYNITVAATLIGRFASENVPVRLIANTPPETIHSDFTAGERRDREEDTRDPAILREIRSFRRDAGFSGA